MPFGLPLVDVEALEKRIRRMPLKDRMTLAAQLLELDPLMAAAMLDTVIAELRSSELGHEKGLTPET